MGVVEAPASVAAPTDRLEVDMRRQILLPEIFEHRRESMAADGLERVAGAAALVPIVDKKGHTALRREAKCNRNDRFIACRRAFDDLAVAVEGEAIACNQDPSLHPADILLHRKRIEKFVCDKQQRCLRAILPTDSCHWALGTGFFLNAAQDRAGLNEMGLSYETGRVKSSERIARQCSPPGPNSGIDRVRRRTGAPPAIGKTAPTISPNIWLISGAVVKSPAVPSGSRVA